MQWFEVDRRGLAKILERRGKGFVVLELLQNAWDQEVTEVDVRLEKPPGSRQVIVTVEDDDPKGFSDLGHAFTLFAESEKKDNPAKRGRFNLGEKLVIALCDEATIETTTGRVRFNAEGRKQTGRVRRKAGSRFTGRIQMTRDELSDALSMLKRVIPPKAVVTRVNGETLATRTPLKIVQASLPTEVADEEGFLKRTSRKTEIRLFEPLPGEVATLYELGLPVVETNDRYHYDIAQKVPVSLERDNVSSAYLRAVRTAVLNAMHDDLDSETASSGWVREGLSNPHCEPEAARSAVIARFGEKSVAYDPSDPEANKIAVSRGYTVVHGGSLSQAEWNNARKAEALRPAGQVTPSAKPFSNDPGAPSLKTVDPDDWTDDESARVSQIQAIAESLIGKRIEVVIANDFGWNYRAAYGHRTMTINRARVGRAWFEGPLDESALSLVIHELGHEYESDHLSHSFHSALCDIGARLALVVREQGDLPGGGCGKAGQAG